MRVFLAVDLPENIRTALSQKQAEFRTSLAAANLDQSNRDAEIRWTNPSAIHLTLKFLGEITDAQVRQVTEALSILPTFAAFSAHVMSFGFFPSAARPHVLWAGVEAPPELAQLALRIERAVEPLKFPREQREFNPHLTLARFKPPRPRPALRSLVENQVKSELGRFEVTEFFCLKADFLHVGRSIGRWSAFLGARAVFHSADLQSILPRWANGSASHEKLKMPI